MCSTGRGKLSNSDGLKARQMLCLLCYNSGTEMYFLEENIVKVPPISVEAISTLPLLQCLLWWIAIGGVLANLLGL